MNSVEDLSLSTSSCQPREEEGGGVPWINPRELITTEYLEEPGGMYVEGATHLRLGAN
jgi:hypothetical protein